MAPPRPYSRLRWAATRALGIIAEDGYSTDENLRAELGLDPAEIRTLISVMYRQRRVDRADGYLVLPSRPHLELVA